MFLKRVMCTFLISGLMISCNNSDSGNMENEKSISNTKEEMIKIMPQALFNKNQLNNDIINLCINFKSQKGSDRKHIFTRLQDLLPNCPDEESSFQVMSPFDLMELLGEPYEIRDDNSIVYSLLSGDSYFVVFSCSKDGRVICRSFEALG